MISKDWETKVRRIIERFPTKHATTILNIWYDWLKTNPQSPFYTSWSDFASERDDSESLFTETRVYVKRVTNELRDLEIPNTLWQKVAKGLAAIASVFLVIFLAVSRIARASE